MSASANLTEAFYQGAWLPCRVVDVNATNGLLLVQVTDRSGTHNLWATSDQVRER